MNHRSSLAVTFAAFLAAGLAMPALADHEEEHHDKRFEVSLMIGYNSLFGDAQDFFDNGPYGGFAFEYAITDPHKKGTFRSLDVRLCGGYEGFDGTSLDDKLKGSVFDLDAMLVMNAGKIVKPYVFFGFGGNNISDDLEIVSGNDGIGFGFGAGAKFFFGDTFTVMAELGNHDYRTQGNTRDALSHLQMLLVRIGFGVRF
ncbi:MAG: outer membrane beta-barrel protein [Acidobacteriota bacterium]